MRILIILGLLIFGLKKAISKTEFSGAFSVNSYKRALEYKDLVLSYKSLVPEIPPSFIVAQIVQESRGIPNIKHSAGEVGLMGIKEIALIDTGLPYSIQDLEDPEKNIHTGIAYLAKCLEYARTYGVPNAQLVESAFRIYNQGPGNFLNDRKVAEQLKYWNQIKGHRVQVLALWGN